MPIAALSEDTVHALSSSQTLNDPAYLVKELVENALDAKASSISVEVSYNTLDMIQVKDNGFGIAPDDREILGRRYCTSKIRDFDDISKLGGRYLGFRGEALASATELSESLTISTRIDGEPVAAILNVGRQGGLLSHDRISHPVGTTVRISNFLVNLLVRKQTALKAPAKTLSKIKSLLQAYALAKPTIRYSLKVSKGSNDSFNWIYPASKSLPASVDAAVKVVGKVVVTQCEWKTWCASLGFIDQKSSANELDDFILEALLPARHCDVAAVSNIGQFVSIDNRPIAHRKNAMKKVISIFKSFLQSSSGTDAKVVNPFLFLNIFCPLGSYDINSEPGKDEVLFTDEERIVTICNSFFRQFYNNLEDDIADEQIKPSYGKASSSLFDEPATSASIASNPRAKTSPIDRARLETTSLEHRLPPKSTMYDGEDDHLDQHVSFGFRDDDPIYDMASPDLTALNPWTIAKLNAPIHSPESRREWQREAQYNGQLLTPQKDVYDAPAVHTPPSRLSFPSKERLVPRGSPPSAPHNGTPLCPASPKKIRQQPQTQGKNLDGWLKKGSPFTAMTPTRPTPISAPLPGTPLSEIPDAPQRLRRQIPRKTPAPTAHKPFVLPVSNKPLQTERTPLPETPPRRTLGFIKSSPRDDGSQLSASWLHDGVPEYRPSARYRDGPSEEEEDIIDSFDTAENARVRVPLLMLATTLHSTRRLAVTLARFDDYVCSGNVRMDGDLVGFSRDFAVMLE